ncbi:hypothetical protein COO60DRAFT_1544152, partial [Scenedesmus sp. NREL 46B-D3]
MGFLSGPKRRTFYLLHACSAMSACLQMVQWAVHCQCPSDSHPVLCALQGGGCRADGVVAANNAQDSGIKSMMSVGGGVGAAYVLLVAT